MNDVKIEKNLDGAKENISILYDGAKGRGERVGVVV